MAVYGYREQDLPTVQNGLRTRALFFAVICAIYASVVTISLTQWGAISTVSGFAYVYSYAILLPLIAQFCRFAFYNWQIRSRSLGSFRSWLANPKLWWPEKA